MLLRKNFVQSFTSEDYHFYTLDQAGDIDYLIHDLTPALIFIHHSFIVEIHQLLQKNPDLKSRIVLILDDQSDLLKSDFRGKELRTLQLPISFDNFLENVLAFL